LDGKKKKKLKILGKEKRKNGKREKESPLFSRGHLGRKEKKKHDNK